MRKKTKTNIIPFKPISFETEKLLGDFGKTENPVEDFDLNANRIPVNYSDVALQLGLSPYSSAAIDRYKKPVHYSDIAMHLGLSPFRSSPNDYHKEPVHISDIALQLGFDPTKEYELEPPLEGLIEPAEDSVEPAEDSTNEESDTNTRFLPNMDTDRAEAMIMQLFGGDESALSNIRTRDINRDTALRSAVATERNDAISREFSKLEAEKLKQEKEQVEREERKEKEQRELAERKEKEQRELAERKEKIQIAEKKFNDAKSKFDAVQKTHSPDTQEFVDARNEYNDAVRTLNGLDPERKIPEIPDTHVSKSLSADIIDTKLYEITSAIDDVNGTFEKGKKFTNADRDAVLKKLDSLYNEPNISKEAKDKINEYKNKLNSLISVEQQKAADAAAAAALKAKQKKNRNDLVNALNTAYSYLNKGGVIPESINKILKKFDFNDINIINLCFKQGKTTTDWKTIKDVKSDYDTETFGEW